MASPIGGKSLNQLAWILHAGCVCAYQLVTRDYMSGLACECVSDHITPKSVVARESGSSPLNLPDQSISSASPYIICDAGGVQITDLRVPPAVRNGSGGALLDCEYSLRQEELKPDSGLVIKWFFNNEPAPVYQWIPGQKPQEMGVLRGKLNLGYRATDHRATMHRALYILNPTTELSGEYKCFVSTFKDEDFMTKKMVVFVPQESLELTDRRPSTESVNLSCRAQGVYPEPKMALYKNGDQEKGKVSLDKVWVRTVPRDGVYDITASTLLDESTLESPTIFDCELKIPEANYMVKKSIVYYAGSLKVFKKGLGKHLTENQAPGRQSLLQITDESFDNSVDECNNEGNNVTSRSNEDWEN
ncbi:uncharacterized protein [Anabrus simplex]|uniref:uncharacterized protein n=1 Tax=Anabrus simplex TaxID=316456 RepID=UPI0035A36BCD